MADDRSIPAETGFGYARGRLLDLETASPLAGYLVEAYDQDLVADDPLGAGTADSEGRFEIRFAESAYKDFGEGEPEVKLHLVAAGGREVGWTGPVRGMAVDFGDVFISDADAVIAPVLDPEAAAICPRCGAVYRAGFSTCNDCEVPLRPLS